MKRVLIAAVAVASAVGMATPAAAQDANGGGWGCFAGAHFAERWANDKFTRTATVGTPIPTQGVRGVAVWGSQSPDNGGYGAQFGCDWHHGPWVFGAQIQHDNGVVGTNVITAIPTWQIRASNQSMETFTGRVGYMVMPDLQAYVRTGFAVAFNYYSVGTVPTTAQQTILQESANTRNIGMVLGGGLEYSVNRDWSVYGEFTTNNFGSYPTPFVQQNGVPGTPDYVRIRQSINQFMLGINYHF